MSEDMLDTLRAIDPAILTDVVRQDQRSDTFEILEWTVKRLSDKGIINPDGLFLFSGEGRDEHGNRSWSVVLKALKGEPDDTNIGNMFYWKREYLLVEAGLMTELPKPVTVPRFYNISERDDGAWIWMEHVVASTNRRWTREQYAFAARQVGRFSAECLNLKPQPDFSWLCRSLIRDWLRVVESFQDWDNAYVVKAFSPSLHERVTQLWDERERFLDVLERLPKVFSHFDFNRRNLFIRQGKDNADELVIIDWALCGYGALGTEAVSVIGDNMIACEIEPSEAEELEAAAFPAYNQGLREGGWQGDEDLVRLAYTIQTALFLGAAAPALVVVWTRDSAVAQQLYGRSPDELAVTWAAMCEFGLKRGDEARQLMDKLGF